MFPKDKILCHQTEPVPRFPHDYTPYWNDGDDHINGLILSNTFWDIRQSFDDPDVTDVDHTDADFLVIYSMLIEPTNFIDIRHYLFFLDAVGAFYPNDHYQMLETILDNHGICQGDYSLGETTYNWELSDTYSSIVQDNTTETVALNFTFNFYGQEYNTVCISDNGFICFDEDPVNPSSPDPLPIPNVEKPNAVIAPFWTDFDPTPEFFPSKIKYLNDTDKFVVSWMSVKYGSNSYRFQVVLYKSGDIVFQYHPVYFNIKSKQNIPHATGIEDETGSNGILYYDYFEIQDDGYSIKFSPK